MLYTLYNIHVQDSNKNYKVLSFLRITINFFFENLGTFIISCLSKYVVKMVFLFLICAKITII